MAVWASCLTRAQRLWTTAVRGADRSLVGLSLLAALALVVTALGAAAPAHAAHAQAATGAAPALQVSGNRIINRSSGLPFQLHGVDRSGTAQRDHPVEPRRGDLAQ